MWGGDAGPPWSAWKGGPVVRWHAGPWERRETGPARVAALGSTRRPDRPALLLTRDRAGPCCAQRETGPAYTAPSRDQTGRRLGAMRGRTGDRWEQGATTLAALPVAFWPSPRADVRSGQQCQAKPLGRPRVLGGGPDHRGRSACWVAGGRNRRANHSRAPNARPYRSVLGGMHAMQAPTPNSSN